MIELPSRDEQIIAAHAALIVHVVRACHNRELVPQVEQMLQLARQNGWRDLVTAIQKILNGSREELLLSSLDEEDEVIIRAILRGLQDPSTLPNPEDQGDPSIAAPGLAAMISAAARGDIQALEILGHMAEQMSKVRGDMARFAAILRRLIVGERNPESLAKGMGVHGKSLLLSVLEELGKL